MQTLGRLIRFSINPFLEEDSIGFNSYCSKPAGEGLAIFFELGVELAGAVEHSTGFVVNVRDIDKCVRQNAVPVFAERIRKAYRQGKHISETELAELLAETGGVLGGKFGQARLSRLFLKLNPFRKIAIDCEDDKMIYFSEKFEFTAMHKLWNDNFSEEKNFEVFGKCANPTGHGHNYIVEVTVRSAVGQREVCIGDFEKVVDAELIKLVDHKNLNADLSHFSKVNPTVENIAAFAWEKLAGEFGAGQLHCITVWETDRTYCSYYGE